MDVLFAHIKMLKLAAGAESVPLSVDRSMLVPSVLEQFGRLDAGQLLQPLEVCFIDEVGVDDGGLTSDLYTQFFAQVHAVLVHDL